MYFRRQVEDFAISARYECIALEIISKVDEHMIVKAKPLGSYTGLME